MKKYLSLFFLVLTANAIKAQIPTTDLQMWYKADAGYSSVIYPATWADQSGNGNDLKTVDFFESPLIVNDGLNQALRFVSSTSYLPFPMYHGTDMQNKIAVIWPATSTGLSVFMVYKLNSPLSNATAGFTIQGNKSSSQFIYGKNNTTGSFLNTNSVISSDNVYTLSNQKEIGSAIFIPNSSIGNTLFINGALKGQVASTGVPANTAINSLSVVSSGVGPNGSIDIYELIVYSSPLITVDRQQVESYLGIKYAITVVLPLQLVSFTGTLNQNQVKLNWKTANETNTALFEVERSITGTAFAKIGSKKAGQNSYFFIDEKAGQSQELYYRLKMIDADGKFTYSNILRLSNSV
ncbi:MAG: hypothetical protein ABI594_21735, partial [Ginsengibacter sp.]